jgi:hypothetical protein
MHKVLVLATALVVVCRLPGAAQDSAASPVPSASPASVLDKTIAVDGVPVPLRAFATLIATMLFVYLPAKGPHATAVIVAKKPGEMPAFDPDFHYAGTDGAPDQPKLTMWVAERLEGKAPRSLMESAAILGLLDSGMGGAPLQQVYAAARKDDLALGPAAADTWKNRRALCIRLTSMVDLLMESMIKQRAADGPTPH